MSYLEDIDFHHYDSDLADICKTCKELKKYEDSGNYSITEGSNHYYHDIIPIKKSRSKNTKKGGKKSTQKRKSLKKRSQKNRTQCKRK